MGAALKQPCQMFSNPDVIKNLVQTDQDTCKRIAKAANLSHANGKRVYHFQKLGSHDFWQICNSNLNKGKSAIPPLDEALPYLSDKAKVQHF